jgi:hypothetical protein
MAKRKSSGNVFPALALVLAWAIPGAGHVYIGRPVRGVIIFITITLTFWVGVAMGGVMTVDNRTERWWFAADMCAGVNGLVSWYRTSGVYAKVDRELLSGEYASEYRDAGDKARSLEEDRNPGYRLSQRDQAVVAGTLRERYVDKILSEWGYRLAAPAETVARAYSGVAGLLNALCIFDAVILSLMGMSAEPASRTRRRAKDAQGGAA